MQIWVDADACPRPVKDILYRVALRRKVGITLVANQPLQVPSSPLIRSLQVPGGFDVADNYIVQHLDTGDLVITADIPLAAEVIASGAEALNPRGELYNEANIRQRLNIRDFMEDLRSTGAVRGGPPPFSQTDRQQFANSLDRWLTRRQPR